MEEFEHIRDNVLRNEKCFCAESSQKTAEEGDTLLSP